MKTQSYVDKEWVWDNGEPAFGEEYIKLLSSGGKSQQQYRPVVESKDVKWSTFEAELPDIVISELENIRNRTTTTTKSVLKAVITLINDMNSYKTFDVFGSEITSLLAKMVLVNLITLNQETANTILLELKNS